MSVGNISNSIFPSLGLAIRAYQNGGMSLPVAPGMVIYSHFRHVSGTPAPEGSSGVNISNLRILNTMIEQLSRMRSQNTSAEMNMDLPGENDEQRINALIEHFQQQMRAAQSIGPYTPAVPETGLLFDIAA